MHIADPTGTIHRKQQFYSNRTMIYAISTVCAMLFLFGVVMLAK